MLPDNKSAHALYQSLKTTRDRFLEKARRCSELTLPFLIPKDGASSGQDYPTPYQSVGARGVNNLSSKLLLSLLPPNTPFFKLAVDRFALRKLDDDPKTKSALEAGLSEIEQAALVEVETSATRVTGAEALLHLIVGGNALMEVPAEGNLKMYRLDRYVVRRDPMGNVLTIIIHEQVAPSTLPPEVFKLVPKKSEPNTSPDKTVNLYTVCQRSTNGKRWEVWQEVGETVIPTSRGHYPIDKLPFLPLRFFKIDGEDYGRGFVEQYLGDLVSLEGLSRAMVEGAQAAAKVVFLVAPNGSTDANVVAKADNGDFVAGNEEDIKVLQLAKFADFQTAYNQAINIEKRLETAFLLLSGVQRNAERVTAEEIRVIVSELETGLGGVYSVLAQELQLPLASALMHRMAKDNRLPKLPKKIVSPTITTGVEALGRGNDLQKLDAFVKDLAMTFGPEAVARYVVVGEYMTRRSTALGINPKGLVRSDEEIQAETQAAQQAAQATELAGKLGPAVIKAGAQVQPPAQ